MDARSTAQACACGKTWILARLIVEKHKQPYRIMLKTGEPFSDGFLSAVSNSVGSRA